jgi:citrate lyase subunit beta/citryl-CoA lyase
MRMARCPRTAWSPNSVTLLLCRPQRSAPALELGYTRMWSIHPAQIRPILEALSPSQMSVDKAAHIVAAAARAHWAPISIEGVLHDRASYRYYWQFLERAHATGRTLPPEVQTWFVSSRC